MQQLIHRKGMGQNAHGHMAADNINTYGMLFLCKCGWHEMTALLQTWRRMRGRCAENRSKQGDTFSRAARVSRIVAADVTQTHL